MKCALDFVQWKYAARDRPHLRLSSRRPRNPPPSASVSALRQLRVAAGLTQSELAGDRFSKEYVSQIERGKTRPTGETIAWLASRLDVDAGYLANGVSTDERGRVEATLTRAEALVEAHRYEEAVAEFEQVRPAVAATGAAELEARLLSGEAWARMHQGELREALELLTRARTVSEARAVLGPRPRRGPLPARRLPLQAFQHLDRDRPLQRGVRDRRGIRAPVRPPPLEHPRLPLALLPAPARPRGRARGRRARARARAVARRQPDDGQRVRPGVARRRAHGPLGARPQLRGAREELLRGAERPAEPRRPAEQPRRAQPHARQAGARRSST